MVFAERYGVRLPIGDRGRNRYPYAKSCSNGYFNSDADICAYTYTRTYTHATPYGYSSACTDSDAHADGNFYAYSNTYGYPDIHADGNAHSHANPTATPTPTPTATPRPTPTPTPTPIPWKTHQPKDYYARYYTGENSPSCSVDFSIETPPEWVGSAWSCDPLTLETRNGDVQI